MKRLFPVIAVLAIVLALLAGGCAKKPPTYQLSIVDDATNKPVNGAQVFDLSREHLIDQTRNYPAGQAQVTAFPGETFVVVQSDYLEGRVILPKNSKETVVVRLQKGTGTVHLYSHDLRLGYSFTCYDDLSWNGECSAKQPVELKLPLNTLFSGTINLGVPSQQPTCLFYLQEESDVMNVIISVEQVAKAYQPVWEEEDYTGEGVTQEVRSSPETVVSVDWIPLNRKITEPLQQQLGSP